jgi:hypothetical protein
VSEKRESASVRDHHPTAIHSDMASFFWVAPILLLCLYVYLHLHMAGIGETLSELPAVFP